jgi:8-oxo-dGTP pyrophosphatase MutT (NUDIX family)
MAEIMKATVPVFVYLIDDRKRVYLQRRFNTGYLDGYYEVPAGKIDVEEFPKQAACREAFEETGITIDPEDLALFHSYLNLSNNRPWLGLMFRTRKWKGTPAIREPEKCDDSRFFDESELPKLTPQVRDGLARLFVASSIELSTYDDIDVP